MMSSVLVIAEKPSVGMSLAAVLGAKERKDGYVEGNGYIVSWCVGHLIGLSDAYDYNEQYGKWRREDLPIIPDEWKYSIFDGKQKQFNTLQNLMSRKDVNSVVNACDSGREGELIFRFVYQAAKCTKPFSRLWISSMEESAIKKGFAEMKDGSAYDSLYFSAICRAKADWLIGINATRLFSILYNKTLNVGRVQTPTLAMLAERQNKISGFVKEKYHKVRLNFNEIEAFSDNISDPQEAEKIQAACHNRQAVCSSLTKEQKIIPPPKLFDLTALQRESNRLFGYTAQQTLDAAQKLYEAKRITYPRTDSRFITSDMAAGITALVQNSIEFLSAPVLIHVKTEQIVNDAKVSDHHAIIPTVQFGDLSKLPDTERNILSLIAARLIFAVADKHVYEAITTVFDCNNYSFTAKGKKIISEGWKKIESFLKFCDASTEDGNAFLSIAEGQIFDNAVAAVTEHFTQPPAPYTEATLLSAMENAGAKETNNEAERRGLGTPATRAAVIEKLVTGGFITRKGRQLIPTADGENLIKILPDKIKSPELTAKWENSLTLIAKGELKPDSFMHEIEEMARDLIKNNSAPTEENKNLFGVPKEAIGICPRCGGNVLESKMNFHCENRECLFVMWKADRFFTSRKKELTKAIAAELLKNGKAKITGLFSEKKNKTYDAVILLADTGGKYVNYRFDIKDAQPKD
jgi:DNA topoisomerase-3